MSSNITKKDLWKVYIRYYALNCLNDYHGQMHNGFTFSLMPALKKIYQNNDEKRVEATTRHMNEYFNVTPYIAGFPLGLTIALEEENAKDENFDVATISSMKAALMGPLSAIGDTLFHATLRIIATALIIDMASKGSILAPIIYLLAFNIPNIIARYWSLNVGYKLGSGFLKKAEKSGIMDKISFASSVIGAMAIGAMSATTVKLSTAIQFGGNIGEGIEPTMLQTLLDSIMPGLLPLALVGVVYWLLGKKANIIVVMLSMLIIGVILFSLGIMA